MSATGQTISYLQRRFTEAGIRVNPRHGQNFLIDLNLLRLLVETADIGPSDVVLEIGTGMGGLSMLLAPLAAAVVTVEIDPRMHQLASEELIDFPNVTLLQQDALLSKHELAPQVLNAVRELVAVEPGRTFKLAANLPYNAATPIISNLLALDDPPRTMTVTIQKELAERICAVPGTKDYSALSIWMQSQCRMEIVRIMGPTVFWPKPKVESAILQIVVDDELRRHVTDRSFFHEFVRTLFLHRRKTLRSGLLQAAGQLGKPGVDRILAQVQIDPGCRAEQLDVETMLVLSEAFRAAG